jgi:hypothetical protein
LAWFVDLQRRSGKSARTKPTIEETKMTHRPAPNFDFARVCSAGPDGSAVLFASDFSDDREPDLFPEPDPEQPYDWSHDNDGAPNANVWESDVDELAALAVARASHDVHAMGATSMRTIERWG